MLFDCYFCFLTLFMWKSTFFLWSVKQVEMSIQKLTIDILMIGCGLSACMLTGVVANIIVRKIEN